jgi:murein DD-endopeptidase MepM/ murein hydrolase activator NlpD
MAKKTNEKQYIKPVEGKITSDFGYRTAPVAGATTNHSGIDIGIPIGTPVNAMADGTVTAANGGMRGYGNGVFIDHGIINGKHVVCEYGHLSSFDVKVGDKIKQGQVVAKSGNSGISSGPHLHITIREDKMPVDPKKYLGNFSN